jgi:acetoin utilization protein AcuB
MLVRDLMQKDVITVTPEDRVDRVFFLIHFEKIRHLPVVEKGQVVGMVSDRDLHKALGPTGRRKSILPGADDTMLYLVPRKARHIMRRGVITISPQEDVARAAYMMGTRKIGALPVVEHGHLVGIVTATDVLLAFARRAMPRRAAR